MESETSGPSKGSSIGNFLKAILLVALAIVLLKLVVTAIGWVVSIILTAIVVIVIGAFIFGVVKAFKKQS